MTAITEEMIAAARKHDHDTRPRGGGGTWGSVPEPQVRRLLEGALARRGADLQIDSIASLFAFMSPGDAMATGAEFLTEIGTAVLERLGVKPVSRPDVSYESDDVVRITITWGTLTPPGSGCPCHRGADAHAHDSDEDGDCVVCGCGRYQEPEPKETPDA